MSKQELLSITTDDFLLSIHGPSPNHSSFAVRRFPGGREATPSNAKIVKEITVSQGDTEWPLVRVELISSRYIGTPVEVIVHRADNNDPFLPLFFENIDYHFQLSNTGDQIFELWHEYSTIRNRFEAFHKHRSSSGTFNFVNNVGQSVFEVRQNGQSHIAIVVTVFSIKVDFLTDRLLMIDELSAVHNALVFKLFEPTKSLGTGTYRKSLGVEWLTTFRQLSFDILATIRRIEAKAHNQIQTTTEVIPAHKLRRPTKSLLQQVSRQGLPEVLSRRNVSIDTRRVHVNTAENRYLKFLMRRLSMMGHKWVSYLRESDLPSLKRISMNEDLISEIDLAVRKIGSRLHSEFWEAVGEESPTLHNKTTFLFQDLFLRFEKLYKTVSRGLQAHTSGQNFIYTLSMAELYQVWTYCKLAQILSGIINGTGAEVSLKVKVDAFNAVLSTGQQSRVRISDEISIGAEWTFTENLNSTYFSPLVEQKPDLVFEITNKVKLNILDAKYRIGVIVEGTGRWRPLSTLELVTEDLSNRKVIFRPQDDDINVIHRYKDAIQTLAGVTVGNPSRRPVETGVILYPHKPIEAERDQLQSSLQSLSQFRIGAVPLAPGKEDLDWLENHTDINTFFVDDTHEQIRVFAYVLRQMVLEASSGVSLGHQEV